MKEIIIKESAKDQLNSKNYQSVLNNVIKAKSKSGIIDRINYLIKSNVIILF